MVQLVPLLRMVLLLSVAGALGTLARFGLQGVVQNLVGLRFPWGTFAVNILGTFAFGVIWQMGQREIFQSDTRMVILTGFMGAFTTFSTLMFETGQMLQDGQYYYAAGNMLGQCGAGIAFLFLGMAMGRLF